MERYGWRVVFRQPRDGEYFTWNNCLELSGGPPDALVAADTSRPPFVLGVERFPCLTLFYAVDTHIHSWMPLYGQACDACLDQYSARSHSVLRGATSAGRSPVVVPALRAPNIPG